MQIFNGRKIVLATMHKKEKVIAPILKKELKLKIIIPKNFNTDNFGTFTREIKRAGDQLEAARKKAEEAMYITGLDLGIASEGSFSQHPSIPFIQSSLELVLLIDKKNNLEIKGHYRSSATNINGEYVSTLDEALKIAKDWDFPKNGLIIRKTKNEKHWIYKDISSLEDFAKRITKILSNPFTKRVFIETDMRAHKNPLRMKEIQKATKDLIKNIKSICPRCKTPGYIITSFEGSLLCSACSLPTNLPKDEIFTCAKCKFSEKKSAQKNNALANPQYCDFCNP